MTAKPTAVVVRLPLSEAQKQTMYDYACGGASMLTTILTIGTPVIGTELKAAAYEHALDFGYGGGGRNVKFTASAKNPFGVPGKDFSEEFETTPRALVYLDEVLAKLAAAQAEIVRLREAGLRLLGMIDGVNPDWSNGVTDSTGSIDEGDMIAGGIIEDFRKALKGPAA